MVYGYKKNKEFIEKTDELLKKLNKKGIWNKDTLIVGLDKSVRPLAYTLGKLSRLEGKETPDLKFFNYSGHDYLTKEKSNKAYEYWEKKISEKELLKYKNILILDEHFYSGNTFKEIKEMMEKKLLKGENKPQLYFSTLGLYRISPGKTKNLIFVDKKMPDENPKASTFDTGIIEEYDYNNSIRNVKRLDGGKYYKKFIKKRIKLRKDIKEYIQANNLGKKEKQNLLEKSVQTVSFGLLILGLIIGSGQITGNIIGNNLKDPNLIGIVLALLGAIGLFLSRKK